MRGLKTLFALLLLLSAPSMGQEESAAEGLVNQVWEVDAKESAMSQPEVLKLRGEVQKLLDALPLRPVAVFRGLGAWREGDRIYFDTAEMISTICMAWPWLEDKQKEQAAKVMKTEIEAWNFLGKFFPKDFKRGKERGWFENYPNGLKEPNIWPDERAPLARLYPLWQYVHCTGDKAIVEDRWNDIKNIYAKQVQQWMKPGVRFSYRGHPRYPKVAGLIGLARLAEIKGDSTIKTHALQLIDEQLKELKMGEVLKRERKLVDKIGPQHSTMLPVFSANLGASAKGSVSCIFSREVAGWLAENPEDVMATREIVELYDQSSPYWWTHGGFNPHSGETNSMLPFESWQLFMMKAYILMEDKKQLRKMMDVPSYAVGDLCYIQRLVAVLEAKE